MNIKKICKVASSFFVIGMILACFSLYYDKVYDETNAVILNKIQEEKTKKILDGPSKKEVNQNEENSVVKDMELGRSRVRAALAASKDITASQVGEPGHARQESPYMRITESEFFTRWAEQSKERAALEEIAETKIFFEFSSIVVFAVSLFIFLFCLILYMKRKTEKTNMEQRIGFLLITTSILIAFIYFIICFIILHRIIYEDNIELLAIYATILATGIILYFNAVSSLIKWVKFGDTRK